MSLLIFCSFSIESAPRPHEHIFEENGRMGAERTFQSFSIETTINDEAKKAHIAGSPVISIDAKKKEKIGNFKNEGKTYQPHKTPLEVLDHDFPIAGLGKATPYGVYDVFKNQGFVNVGLSADTAMFAVESIRRWWHGEGINDYAGYYRIVNAVDKLQHEGIK